MFRALADPGLGWFAYLVAFAVGLVGGAIALALVAALAVAIARRAAQPALPRRIRDTGVVSAIATAGAVRRRRRPRGPGAHRGRAAPALRPDYRVVCEGNGRNRRGRLERMRDRAEAWRSCSPTCGWPRRPGSELLDRVRSLHPHAKRALLIDWGAWGDRPTAEAILHAMATGPADYYVLKPSRAGEEQFHRAISEFLHEWSREHSESSFELAIIAEPACAADARDPRPAAPQRRAAWVLRSGLASGARAARRRRPRTPARPPVVRLRDGTVLVDPTNEEIVEAFGVDTGPVDDPNFDLVIVGAGPAGLSGGGLRAVGGPAHARGRARDDRRPGRLELADPQLPRLRPRDHRRRARPARLPAGVGVRRRVRDQPRGRRAAARRRALRRRLRRRLRRHRARGPARHRRHLPRIGIPGLEALTGAGVYYGASTVEGLGLASEDVYVIGGGNSAGQAALHLSRSAARVRLLVRGPSLAADMSQYLRETIEATPNVDVLVETEVVDGGGTVASSGSSCATTRPARPAGRRRGAVHPDRRPAANLLAAASRSPWRRAATCSPGADDREPEAERWPLERPPSTYETSVPGRVRGRRHPLPGGQAGRVGGRRGLGRDPRRPRVAGPARRSPRRG